MSEKLRFVLEQLRFCEDRPGHLLPADDEIEQAFLTSDGLWDRFLFVNPESNHSNSEEIVRGLWRETLDLTIDQESHRYIVLRSNSTNRIHFSGFIVDLIQKMLEMSFEDAFEITIEEWKSRWRDRAEGLSFIERVGLFGELVALRDFITCGGVTDSSSWVARDAGDGLHDFVIANRRFEVKTSTVPIADIHIFDEDQMHHRNGLFLLLVKTEISEEGESIDDVAIDIARAIVPHGESNEFLDKLRSAGFSFDTYLEDRFIVQSKYFWESNPSQTPFIQYSDIDRGLRPVTNINYQILETEIKLSEIDDFGNLLN